MSARLQGARLGTCLPTHSQPIRGVAGRPGRPLRHGSPVVAAQGRPFADFLQFEEVRTAGVQIA